MESLPSVGAHCSLASCNVNDFLPIRCQCDRLFCKDHISPELHSCPAIKDDSARAFSEKLHRCAVGKCNRPSLEAFLSAETRADADGRTAATCLRCGQAFCAIHREPTAHACATPDPTLSSPPRNEAAQALIEKIKGSQSSRNAGAPSAVSGKQKTSLPSNPRKAAQLRQVELMKMRHRAEPGDPRDKGKEVPIEHRVNIKVSVEGRQEEKVFWFRKTIGAGKVLDMLRPSFHISATAPISMVNFSADGAGAHVELQYDKVLAEQIEDGSQLLLRPTT